MSRGARSRILLSGLLFGASAGVLFGWYVPRFTAQHGAPIIDLQGWHTAAQTLSVIGAYTPAARLGYLRFLAFDCAFPVTGAWFVISLVRGAFESSTRHLTLLRWAQLFPALSAAFDLLENACYGLMAYRYPHDAARLADIGFVCTSAKFVCLMPNYLAFVVALSAIALQQVQRLRSSGS